jgi:glutaminyl-peptide cyclotransferase
MKRITLSLLTIFFMFIILMNCAQSNSHSRRPVTSIQSEPKRKNYKMGEVLQVNFNTKLKDGSLDKIEIFVDGKLQQTSKNLTNVLTYKTTDFGVGKHMIKISATKSDGTSGENYEEIFVTSDVKPIKYTYQIVATYPHDVSHFTQGLEFHDNTLYEGTGQEGSSAIYRLDLKTGKAQKETKLEYQYFGEGITILNNKIFELTYKNDIGFVYDLNTFKILNTWKYKSKEGWGLTNDGKSLVMSDGTENIYFIHPENYKEINRIQVCDEHNVVKNLNELEYIKGEIWANIWTTDNIVIIDPKTGKVTGEVDLSGISGSILQNQKEQMDVLNGIAWNPVTDKIYVTGKLWPKLFEIKLIRK